MKKIYKKTREILKTFQQRKILQTIATLPSGEYWVKYQFSPSSLIREHNVEAGISTVKVAVDAALGFEGKAESKDLASWVAQGQQLNGYGEIGWEYASLIELARQYGLVGKVKKYFTWPEVCQEILKDQVVIVSTKTGEDTTSGHLVIVKGFKVHDTQCIGLYVFDPFGRNSEQFWSVDDFEKKFLGRGMVFEATLLDSYWQAIKTNWVEVDLDAIAHNVRCIKKKIERDCLFIANCKSNAYGHGLLEIATTCIEAGADVIAVADVEEALLLRNSGVAARILALYSVPTWDNARVIRNDIEVAVFDRAAVRGLAGTSREFGKKAKVHVKVDTGFGWFGVMWDQAFELIKEIVQYDSIELAGIFSHFSMADEHSGYTKQQFERFLHLKKKVEEADITVGSFHLANSAAILDFPETYLGGIRPGIILYGHYPKKQQALTNPWQLQSAFQLKSRLIQIKELPIGFKIGYAGTFETTRKTTIGIVPLGYYDGLRRSLSNSGNALVVGQKVPIVGRICMNMCMLDLTDITKKVRVGDEVVFIGKQGELTITVDEIAEQMGTINYEVLVGIGKHVKRIYI